MASAGKTFNKTKHIIEKLPEGQHFDTDTIGLNMQAETNEQARTLRSFFPGVKWKREYIEGLWWQWVGEWEGISIQIYAIKEPPNECKAITKTVIVKKQVPVAFEEHEVEKTVIVGWDCGGKDETQHDQTQRQQ